MQCMICKTSKAGISPLENILYSSSQTKLMEMPEVYKYSTSKQKYKQTMCVIACVINVLKESKLKFLTTTHILQR